MFCESYRKPLMDYAVAGEDLPRALDSHLAECPGCAEAFQAEKSLLAMIDFGLQRNANADMPDSLIAGVRQRIAATKQEPMGWVPALAFAVALLMVGGFAVREALHNSVKGLLPERTNAVPASSIPTELHSLDVRSAEADASGVSNGTESLRRSGRKVGDRPAIGRSSEVTRNPESASFEVLAAPGEAAGLEQYMKRLRSRSTRMTAGEEVKSSGRLEIRDVEIAELDLGVMAILPLDGAK